MTNDDQREFWSDQAGPTWVARQRAMDAQLAPVLDALLTRADLRPGMHVLDIGCGAGQSTLRAADRTGSALGVDISSSLLDAARRQAGDVEGVRFLLADAQDHDFDADAFDAMISRFGTMFFGDFAAAFTNIARALKPGARIAFATWGQIAENPYFTLPAGIAKTHIGAVPKSDPDEPGPFALRDVARVSRILDAAGFVDETAEQVPLELTPPGTRSEVATLMCDIGPAQRALSHFEADPEQRQMLEAAIADALVPYETDTGIRLPALINFFTAQKPA